jgi:hypothetical protein
MSPGTGGLIDIPRTIEEVDARWLGEALGRTHPGLVVESAKVVQSLGGACTKLRVEIETNRADFPRTVIVKGCFEPHARSMTGPQLFEALAYRELVPRLSGVQTARIFFLQADEARDSAIIMEDLNLRGAHCLRALEPIEDFALAARFVDAMAKLHSYTWNSAELGDDGPFAWAIRLGNDMIGNWEPILADPARTAEVLSSPRGAATPRRLHDMARLRRAFQAMFARNEAEPKVLTHGDPHLSNLFVDAEGGAGLLDWTCFRTHWMHDAGYFVVGCLDVVDRRKWEGPLLAHYLDRLAAYGVAAPGFDHAWEVYRRSHVWGLTVWLLNRPDYHTEAMITAMAARFAAAAIDHDTYGLLGV